MSSLLWLWEINLALVAIGIPAETRVISVDWKMPVRPPSSFAGGLTKRPYKTEMDPELALRKDSLAELDDKKWLILLLLLTAQ